MKEHLINLLFEEYKLSCFINKLNEIGLIMDRLNVKNHEIVMDIIGFPKDNTIEFLTEKEQDTSIKFNRENPPDEFFCRDWLDEPFFDVVDGLNTKQNILLTDKGLRIEEDQDESRIKLALSGYIDWLYEEFNKLNLQ